MADFGAVGTHRGTALRSYAVQIFPVAIRLLPTVKRSRVEALYAFGSQYPYTTTPTISEIRGVVKQGTEILPYAEVALYWRDTKALAARTRANFSGQFVFADLIGAPEGYFAVAFDPEGAPNQNALVFDKLTPVPGVGYDIKIVGSLKGAYVGSNYRGRLALLYPYGAVTLSISAGALPSWMTMTLLPEVDEIEFTGVPPNTDAVSFTVRAADSRGFTEKAVTLTVASPQVFTGITSLGASPGPNSFAERLGWEFQVGATNLLCNMLRFHSEQSIATPENVRVHRVSDGALIASANLVPVANTWVTATVESFTLQAGQSYIVSHRNGGQIRHVDRNVPTTFYAGLTKTGNRIGYDDLMPTVSSANNYNMCDFGYTP